MVKKMKYLKLLKLKILLWLVNWERTEDIKEEEQFWLADCHKDPGFKSYCKIRNLEILKQIALSIEKRDFQRAMELNGQRMEILKLQFRSQLAYKRP